MVKLSPTNPILKNLIDSEKTPINSEETGLKSKKTTQSKENKNKEEKSKVDESTTATPQEIIDLYNGYCTNLIKCTQLTDKRLISVLNTKFTIDELKQIFEKANNSSFLTGKNDSGFKANFDWIINPNNALKILEGNYDNIVQKGNNIADTHDYSQEEMDRWFEKDNDDRMVF